MIQLHISALLFEKTTTSQPLQKAEKKNPSSGFQEREKNTFLGIIQHGEGEAISIENPIS